jgi:thiol-disulfide isomerase/thioredoxin
LTGSSSKPWLLLPLLIAGLTCGADISAQEAPAMVDLQGEAVTLRSFHGRVVLVNVWATWCGPCREEMPELNRLYGELDHAHATVIGIAADDHLEVKDFVARLGIHYPIVTGNPDQLLAWTASLGNLSEGLPFSVLLDGGGSIRWVHSGGGLTASAVRKRMHDLLATGAPSGTKEKPQ